MTSVASIASNHTGWDRTPSDCVSVLLMMSRRKSPLDVPLPHLSFLFLTFSLLHQELILTAFAKAAGRIWLTVIQFHGIYLNWWHMIPSFYLQQWYKVLFVTGCVNVFKNRAEKSKTMVQEVCRHDKSQEGGLKWFLGMETSRRGSGNVRSWKTVYTSTTTKERKRMTGSENQGKTT